MMTVEIITIQPSSSTSPVNPLNPLSKSTRKYLRSALKDAIDNPKVTSIILHGGTNFSAGADIGEFSPQGARANVESTEEIPSLTDLCNLMEESPKPIVAALTGVALGGGLELALASHFRIAASNARIGLPEVKLGLIPGAGGTQRLPRLCKDVSWSLHVISSGRMVEMEEARAHHVINWIVPKDENILEACIKWTEWAGVFSLDDLRNHSACRKRVIARDDFKGIKSAQIICDAMLKKSPPEEKGGEALHAAVATVRASFENKSFQEGMDIEASYFWKLLLNSQQGKALRYAFFAERLAQKNSNSFLAGKTDVGKKLLGKNASSVGVVGAGTMGSGITISFLRAGYRVILVDNRIEGIQRGKRLILNTLQQDVAKKRMSQEKLDHIVNECFFITTEMEKLSPCLLVVEAIFENLKLKQSIFRKLDDIVAHKEALLLSNTSSLDIDSIASVLSFERRAFCAGMHFFSPAHMMRLVEIIVSSSSSVETIALIQLITSKKLQKVGVTVGNCEGFVGNRMLFPYTGEAVFILEEQGASVEAVDEAVTNFGMAIGPLAVGDLAGNDIGYLVRKEKGITNDTHPSRPNRYSSLSDDLVSKLGRVGQKKLKGWYDYDPKIGKGRKPIPSREVEQFIASYSKGSPPTPYKSSEIIERVIFAMVNEGFKILQENIAQRPSDIDIIYLYGYGWPAWRGGPMFWADTDVGLPYLLSRLEEFDRLYPGSSYYKASNLLRKCVQMNISLQDYYARGYHKCADKRNSERSKL